MKVFSIRHGEQLYPYNKAGKKLVCGVDAPLVSLGRQQMRDLGKRLEDQGIVFDAVYRSPLLRAQQSAEELVAGLTSKIYVVDYLKEVFPNRAEGKTYEELEERGGDVYDPPYAPDQETLESVVQRQRLAIDFILNAVREHGYNTIAIIGHGDPLCALNWVLMHNNSPAFYSEMRDLYYPQKAHAKEYIIGDNLTLENEGRIIAAESAKQSTEDFRSSSKEKDY